MNTPITASHLRPSVYLSLSTDAESALGELRKLIASWRSAPHNKTPPHYPIGEAACWRQLVEGGWHHAGLDLGDDGVTRFRDLIAFSELLGSEQVALPAIGTLLAHRWMHVLGTDALASAAPDAPLSVALPVSPTSALVPFGRSTMTLVQRERDGQFALVRFDANYQTKDDGFAQTLPLLSVQTSAVLDERLLREAVLLYVASAVGCADRCLWRAVEYARERKAYGQPIGSFQAIKHMLADMYRDTELARSGVIGAEHETEWLPLVTHCVELARRVTAHSIQVHGGIGFTWDAGLHFHTRHVLAVSKLVTSVTAFANG